jgi:hypothetical protein
MPLSVNLGLGPMILARCELQLAHLAGQELLADQFNAALTEPLVCDSTNTTTHADTVDT